MANSAISFSFSGRNEAAQQAAEDYAAELITNVAEETRTAIRAIVVRSIREGIPPLEAARMIRDLIGMTAVQAQAAMNYKAELRLQGLSDDRMQSALEFFSAKKLQERSTTIAQTEILGALNAGSWQSWLQAQKKGLLTGAARKKWITTPDEKLCPVCRPMDRHEEPLNRPFILPNGKRVQYPPAHPRCRCTLGEPTRERSRRSLLALRDAFPDAIRHLRGRGVTTILPSGDLLSVDTPVGRGMIRIVDTVLRLVPSADDIIRNAKAHAGFPFSLLFEPLDGDPWAGADTRDLQNLTLTINPTPEWRSLDRLIRAVDIPDSFAFVNKRHPAEGILIHEYGHLAWRPPSWLSNSIINLPMYAMREGGSEAARTLRKMVGDLGLDPDRLLRKSVSEYSAYAMREFIAETFAALVARTRVADSIRRLYDFLHGPEVGL
jgi:hypothetical protein